MNKGTKEQRNKGTIDYKRGYRTKPNLFKKLFWLLPFSLKHFKTINFIKHIIPKVNSVVDVGSSEGKFLYLLKLRSIKNLKGIEPNIYYSEFCEKYFKIPVIKKYIEEVPIIKADLVTAIAILEHLENPENFIRRIDAKYLFLVFPIENPIVEGHIQSLTFREVMDMFYKYHWKPIKIELYWKEQIKSLDLFILLEKKNR
ncbi:hypothetical protein A3K72_01040 [Candidatus Woesearchaeota archaeon RBG_13_36_6]|nr:MAG: hypothetical protein A3K72_01040 [Candidatus Woesearchaeota archaeon RBG_13_36_6]